ncbi:hypothetical protein M569_15868 [Genlisea aurea]|uniref:Uncharacterized protein n=1 Tax=Genlisea aurea TaxID=192259 RepID=S8BX72_9LAMI|nr:hypothetical protein M569_15868 [Genlisea aurea]
MPNPHIHIHIDSGKERSVGKSVPHTPAATVIEATPEPTGEEVGMNPNYHDDYNTAVAISGTVEEVPPAVTEGQKPLEEIDKQLEETNKKLLALLERQPKLFTVLVTNGCKDDHWKAPYPKPPINQQSVVTRRRSREVATMR